jgi:hypothetical protein
MLLLHVAATAAGSTAACAVAAAGCTAQGALAAALPGALRAWWLLLLLL